METKMTWNNPKKRYVMAIFREENPPDPEGYGDVSPPEEFDSIDEAKDRATKLFRGGRFKRFVLWDGQRDALWKPVFDFLSKDLTDSTQ
ncbi:MAG: hypothetical protein F8N15_08420 [Methanobacterium sp.]|nr:hypothetical protein [Methanobacterium sp.]